jgi:antitoxin component YwqK of YwqJK toxin-antitoxin module
MLKRRHNMYQSDEKDKSFYPSGKLKVEVIYENDKDSGVEKWYYESGGLDCEIPFINGNIRHGTERWFYESGNIEKEIPYENGVIVGMEKQYFEKGGLYKEVPYENGTIKGLVKCYYSDGGLESETPYLDGIVHGVKKSYHQNGGLNCETEYENEVKHGLERWYFESGILRSETNFENGNRQGSDREFFGNGNLRSETFFQDGILTMRKEYGSNGDLESEVIHDINTKCMTITNYGIDDYPQIRGVLFASFGCSGVLRHYINFNKEVLTYEAHYEYGNMVLEKKFFENGVLKEEIPQDKFRIHGIKKEYLENGSLKCESVYEKGVLKEEILYDKELCYLKRTFYDNKRLETETPYVNGKKHGDQKCYDKHGKFLMINSYKNDELIETNKPEKPIVDGEYNNVLSVHDFRRIQSERSYDYLLERECKVFGKTQSMLPAETFLHYTDKVGIVGDLPEINEILSKIADCKDIMIEQYSSYLNNRYGDILFTPAYFSFKRWYEDMEIYKIVFKREYRKEKIIASIVCSDNIFYERLLTITTDGEIFNFYKEDKYDWMITKDDSFWWSHATEEEKQKYWENLPSICDVHNVQMKARKIYQWAHISMSSPGSLIKKYNSARYIFFPNCSDLGMEYQEETEDDDGNHKESHINYVCERCNEEREQWKIRNEFEKKLKEPYEEVKIETTKQDDDEFSDEEKDWYGLLDDDY